MCAVPTPSQVAYPGSFTSHQCPLVTASASPGARLLVPCVVWRLSVVQWSRPRVRRPGRARHPLHLLHLLVRHRPTWLPHPPNR